MYTQMLTGKDIQNHTSKYQEALDKLQEELNIQEN
jgi:hypothetical protein